MLDRNAMAQLKGLREELEAQNEHVDATVKGTQHRYGFAVTEDGREIFVPPDEMRKVLPGDKVAICIRPAKPVKGKQDKPGAGPSIAISLVSRTPDRRLICYPYNDPSQTCDGKCNMVHVCRVRGCHAEHPMYQCPRLAKS